MPFPLPTCDEKRHRSGCACIRLHGGNVVGDFQIYQPRGALGRLAGGPALETLDHKQCNDTDDCADQAA